MIIFKWFYFNSFNLILFIFIRKCLNENLFSHFCLEWKNLIKNDGKCWGFEPNCLFNNSYSFNHIKCQKYVYISFYYL